jgi:hypothetical protein
MRTILSAWRLSRPRAILVAFLMLALVVISAAATTAADPFVSGQPSTRALSIGAAAGGLAIARAAALGHALGLPDGTPTAKRFDDRFDHQVYDEITIADAKGRPVAIERLDDRGQLLMAVGLGWKTAADPGIGASGAIDRARSAVSAAGLMVSGTPVARRSASSGGWSVVWPRTSNGVPVRGDGVRVALWADGSFHALSRTERPLADRPSRTLLAADARAVAVAFLDSSFRAASRAELNVAEPSLEWVAPNDTFDAARPDAPGVILRLAWIVEARAEGALAERLNAVEVWVDAGDGVIIGGDVAE